MSTVITTSSLEVFTHDAVLQQSRSQFRHVLRGRGCRDDRFEGMSRIMFGSLLESQLFLSWRKMYCYQLNLFKRFNSHYLLLEGHMIPIQVSGMRKGVSSIMTMRIVLILKGEAVYHLATGAWLELKNIKSTTDDSENMQFSRR